jgi:hypothetical protein
MVSRDSAIYPLSENCNQIAIQEDHSKMVKFRSRADPHYQRVFAKIEEMMENHDREAKLSDSSFTPMETTTPKTLFMVPFPKNDDYTGKSQICEFIDGKMKPCNNQQTREHIRVGPWGLAVQGESHLEPF